MDKLVSFIKGDTKKYILVGILCIGGAFFEYYTGINTIYKYNKKGQLKTKIVSYHKSKASGFGWALIATLLVV